DAIQVVLSQRLSFDIKKKAFDIYRALRTVNPSPYMYFLKFGDIEINLGPQTAKYEEVAPDSVASLNSGGASAECVSDYENPDLWGDAGDPVASLRAHKEARLASRQANGEIDGT
ncbi:MAG: chorismate-binding protein, partial [Alcanivorax sp.]|nr:chorismate-binding protein [Alcanivorax sp.]